MNPRPHDGPAEEGLSSSLLQIVHDPEQVECLRAAMSGFCHRCRNTLNGIKMSLYLFRREARGAVPDCWGELESIYQQVEHLFDHLQTIYRPMPIATVRSPLGDLMGQHVPKWRSWFESRGLGLRLEPPRADVAGDFDPAQLGVGLDAMAAWRAAIGAPGLLACVGWGGVGDAIEIRWREVRPSGPSDPPEHAGGPERGGGGPSPRRVDVLALPLLARVVAAHGGRLHCESRDDFSLRLRWPQYRSVG